MVVFMSQCLINQGSYATVMMRPNISWRSKEVKSKPFVNLQMVGRLNKSASWNPNFCIRSSPLVVQRDLNHLKRVDTLLRGNSHNNGLGGSVSGNRASRNYVKVSAATNKADDNMLCTEDQRRAKIMKVKEENKGSVEFQVSNFTNKIRRLTSHLELHKKDYSTQRGLRKILGKRQRLLAYLSKENRIRYKELIGQLNIREAKSRLS